MAVTNPPNVTGVAGTQRGETTFSVVLRVGSLISIALLIALVGLLLSYSLESIGRFGFKFFASSDWDPVAGEFGAFPFIFGTIVTSLIGLILAAPLAIGAALFVSEYAPRWLGGPVSFLVELLVAIPSVAYGIWGIFVLVPIMRDTVNPFLQNTLGRLPLIGLLFPQEATIGYGMLTAGVVLAIMILPTILSISREIITQVPRLQKEGILALGATKWETLRYAVLPYARAGIVGAAMLGLARALGETMAVTMVIGNSSRQITASLFTPGYTISSAIANQFVEADSSIYFSSIVELALVLLLVASVINISARLLVTRMTRLPGGANS